jgi:hypothetical protein
VRPVAPCRPALLALALCLLLPCASRASDAVAALRASLRPSRGEEPVAAALKEREKRLNQCVAALKTIPDLSQALALPDWLYASEQPGFEAVDQAARTQISRRLQKALDEVASKGDVPRRLGVAHLIGGLAAAPRSLEAHARGFANSQGPLLIRLCQDPEPAVRAAAARNLGRIKPDMAAAAAALSKILS